MLSALFRFELKYHFRQTSFKVAALLFFALGALATTGGFGGAEVYKNAPYVINNITGLLSLLSVFTSTLFCANVVLRDTAHGLEPVVFATAIRRHTYVMVRFSGLLLMVLFVLTLALPGIALGALLADDSQLGPFRLRYFWQPLLLFGLPNVLFSCSIIFTTTLLTRNTKAVYVAGVLLYILYWTASILGNSPLLATSSPEGASLLPALLDPFGQAVFFYQTRSWSDLQRNTQLFPLEGWFLWNRLLWTGISLLVLGIGYRFFPFRLLQATGGKSKSKPATIPVLPFKSFAVKVHGLGYAWSAFRSQLRLELASLFKQISFLVLLLLWIFVFTVELNDTIFSGPFGIFTYPLTGILVEELRAIRPAMLLIIFFAAELSGREKTAGMQALTGSSPAPNAVFWLAKCTTLAVFVLILVTVNILAGIALQLTHRWHVLDLPLYCSLYYYSALPLILYAVLALLIQTVFANKYLGMMINVVLAALLIFSRKLGLEHFLLRYATVPDMSFSLMNGFGHYTKAFHWYMLYWSSVAGMLGMLGVSLWKRDDHLSPRQRLSGWKRQGNSGSKGLLLVCLLCWISSGGYIYYQTNIIGTYKSSKAQKAWQLEYERRYRPLAAQAQPMIRSISTKIALYLRDARYTVTGSYVMKNESQEPIGKLWIGISPEVTRVSLSVPGAGKPTVDKVFGQYVFGLQQPLLPSDTISLQFSMEVIRSGFSPFNNEHSVVSNGSYIELEKYIPFVGYNDSYESDEVQARLKAGLPAENMPGAPDTAYHLVSYESEISTDGDQQVVTTGALQRSWSKAGRNYFHYKTVNPGPFMIALSSARYALLQENYKGVQLRILYPPGASYNVAVMMKGMKDALDYCTANFGPYTLPYLSLAAIPQYRGTATAYPGVIFCVERYNFLSDFRNPEKINHTYATVVHEVAHQWWAGQLEPAYGPGSDLLTESIAKYIEAVVIERHFGKMLLQQYLRTDNNFYFIYRDMSKEQPLTLASGQSYVHYQKGGLTLFRLKEMLGAAKLNAALRSFYDQHVYPGRRALPADLVKAIGTGASNSQQQLIRELMQQVILYNLKIEVLRCQPLKGGKFSVDLKVTIDKNESINGAEVPVAINEDLDIGLFEQLPKHWQHNTQALYLQKHHFEKRETLLQIVTETRPGFAGVDPFSYILDANLGDNFQEIK